jgi:hypothetical protein
MGCFDLGSRYFVLVTCTGVTRVGGGTFGGGVGGDPLGCS